MMTLNDVCEFIVDTKHKTPKFTAEGYPCIRTPNIGRGYFILDGAKCVSEESYLEWTERATPKEKDLIFAREAPVGNVAIIPANLKVCHGQRTVLIRPNKMKVDAHYLMFLLLGDEIQNRILSMASGATVAHLNMSDIRALELPLLPSIENQKKIASILSTYDDLVENNNRRIAILEEMARSLYKEWFVKFRFPGHEEVKMVDSALGQIPEGWRVVKLFDTASPTYGYAFKSSLFNDKEEGTPVVRIRDILKNISNTFTPEHPKKQDQILKNGDLLIGMDGDFHMGKWAGGHAYLNQRVVKITPKEGYSAYFTFLSMEKSIKELNVSIVGTTVAHLGDSHLKEIQIILPEEKIRLTANAILDLLFKQEINLRVRNQNLKTQRDMLLPKLISGKIEIAE